MSVTNANFHQTGKPYRQFQQDIEQIEEIEKDPMVDELQKTGGPAGFPDWNEIDFHE